MFRLKILRQTFLAVWLADTMQLSRSWIPFRYALFTTQQRPPVLKRMQSLDHFNARRQSHTIVSLAPLDTIGDDRDLYDDSSSSSWDLAFQEGEDENSFDKVEDDDDEGEEEHGDEGESIAGQDGDPLLQEGFRWKVAVDKCLLDCEKTLRSLNRELEKTESIESVVKRAQLLTSNLYLFSPGVTSVTVQDWENEGQDVVLELDPSYSSAAEEADEQFQKARKLKRGSLRVRALIEEKLLIFQSIQKLQTDLDKVLTNDPVDEYMLRFHQDQLMGLRAKSGFEPPAVATQTTRVRRVFQAKQKPAIGSPASNVRKLTTPAGSLIFIGRNRRGNEYLSMTKAKPNDLWMHARGTPGAHVLIPQSRGMMEPTEDCLQLAANLAAFYSDGRNEKKTPVTLVQAKHVLKPRGAPMGAVKLRQEDRIINGVPDDVPDDFKEAREQSGQLSAFGDNGYRSADKAKRRKQAAASQKSKKTTKKSKQKT
jgi:hypothetical protein